MVDSTYSFKRMLDDLKCDFKRYASYCGYNNKLSLWDTVKVLIECPVFFAIVIFRFGVWSDSNLNDVKYIVIRLICRMLYNIGYFLSVIFFKVTIEGVSKIGPGLFLSKKGNIIAGVRSIGANCTIHHDVTIGWGLGINDEEKTPEMGNDVWIGSGSIIYGSIEIGDGVKISESTVLSKSVPAYCHVVGNPGRIIKKDESKR